MSTNKSPAPSSRPPVHPLMRVFHFFTSLKLAVFVLGLSALLVLMGTYAQVSEGLGLAQARWFKSWIVIRKAGDPWYVLLYPGGYTLGLLLLINIVGGHLRRFKTPPGGLGMLLLHYTVVMAALFVVTYSLLWNPLVFFSACAVVLVVDMIVSSQTVGWKRLGGTGRKIGVDMTHVGIVVLLVGQLATDMLAVETRMTLDEGQTGNYSESWSDHELAFSRDFAGDPQKEEVVAIPGALLAKHDQPTGEVLSYPKLPFRVTVKKWMGNSELIKVSEVQEAEATLRQALATVEATYTPDGLVDAAKRSGSAPLRRAVWENSLKELGEKPGEDLSAVVAEVVKQPERAQKLADSLKAGFRSQMVGMFKKQDAKTRLAAEAVERGESITETSFPPQASCPLAQTYHVIDMPVRRDMEARNIPAAVVELSGKDGSLGTWLVSMDLKPQTFNFDGQEWRIALRSERTYYPFSLKLLKATHLVYAGTDEPRDFRSRIRIIHPAKNEDRETEIYMNAPLRYEGSTFFQYQMGREAANQRRQQSTLQVVKNPSWFSPYFGCVLVGYGMLRHFLLHLLRSNRKRSES